MATFGSPWDDYHKWHKWAYEQTYGAGSWDGKTSKHKVPKGFEEYRNPFKTSWNKEFYVGVLERDKKFIGVACIVAEEIVDKESFVRKFGLSFEKEIQWKAASTLLDYLSRSPLFEAVLVTINKVPFMLEPDVSEELKGRLKWARRIYNWHKYIAEGLKKDIKRRPRSGYPHRQKQMKEEEDYARKFLQTCRSTEKAYLVRLVWCRGLALCTRFEPSG